MHGSEVIGRLRCRFGLGSNPSSRMKLYVLLQRAALADEVVGEVISQLELESVGKRSPDRWFMRSVVLRLRELDLLGGGGAVRFLGAEFGELPADVPLQPKEVCPLKPGSGVRGGMRQRFEAAG